MYIKYRYSEAGYRVRDVRHFAIRRSSCEEADGSLTDGAEIYDAGREEAADFADTFAAYQASLIADDAERVEAMSLSDRNPVDSLWDVYANEISDDSALAWFRSRLAADKVMGHLCEALAAGKQFFDMTRYGEGGEERRA